MDTFLHVSRHMAMQSEFFLDLCFLLVVGCAYGDSRLVGKHMVGRLRHPDRPSIFAVAVY